MWNTNIEIYNIILIKQFPFTSIFYQVLRLMKSLWNMDSTVFNLNIQSSKLQKTPATLSMRYI